jgi:hypothetical protein
MSVIIKSFVASFGGIYNIPQAPDPTSLTEDKFLIIGTPTSAEMSFGITLDKVNLKGVVTGDFQLPSAPLKNLLEFNSNTAGTVSSFKLYADNKLMQSEDYSPSISIADSALEYTDKTAAARIFSGNDTFIGATDVTKNDSGDFVDGFDGNDVFYGNGSGKDDDTFYGGNGIDTSIFRSKLSNYTIVSNSALWNQYTQKNNLKGFHITDKVGADGRQQVSGVERLKFSDTSVALDIDGNAGTALKVLAAVFGKSAVNNKQYVGICLELLDKGMSYDTLAGLALGVAQATTNDQIVTTLWTNVVGSAPTASDKAPFIKLLQDGLPAGALTHLAADTSINTTNINLVGLAQTGIEFTPLG